MNVADLGPSSSTEDALSAAIPAHVNTVTEAMFLQVCEEEDARLLNALARRVGRSHAPDLRDQVLLEFFVWWPAHPEHLNPVAVLYMIAQRRAVDHLKREGRTLLVEGEDLEELATAIPMQDPYGAADFRIDLQRALDGLSDRERRALELRFLDGMPVAACAALLGTGIDNTKKILKAARRKLREAPAMTAFGTPPMAAPLEVRE
ncbi:RNA polymerase sigma factor [Streptomyces sp. NPDC054962]